MDQPQSSTDSLARSYITPIRTDEIDRVVLSHITNEPIGAVDLHRWGFSHVTLRDSLGRLLKADLIDRRWVGNECFGRYLYSRKAGA